MLRQRLIDMYIAEWCIDVNIKPSLILYKRLNTTFDRSCYLEQMNIPTYRNAVARLRLSSHQLLIETGRHRNIKREDRKCTLCNLNDIEDEFHFMLVCPFYQDLRHIYISMLNSSNLNVLNAIGIYYTKANHKRVSVLNVVND